MEGVKRVKRITLCLDLYGCPSRCRHCWLGEMPTPRLTEEDLRFAAEQFRPYAQELEVFSWCREPDYPPEYKRIWALEEALSTSKTPHFELMSLWRAARDAEYIPWLASLGVKKMQLTLFGGRAMTDKYYARNGAYEEICRVIPQLIENKIEPRLQVLLNRENSGQMEDVVRFAEKMGLPAREGFEAFVHAGSCDGRNAALYPLRATVREVEQLPSRLVEWTEKLFQKPIAEVFGRSEAEWCGELACQAAPIGVPEDENLVLNIDGMGGVYPNYTAPSAPWRLGVLHQDDAAEILRRHRERSTPALCAMQTVSVATLVETCGDAQAQGLFTEGDYLLYLLNCYCGVAGKEGRNLQSASTAASSF